MTRRTTSLLAIAILLSLLPSTSHAQGEKLDAYRQPLPKGALVRLGQRVDTANATTHNASVQSPDGKLLAAVVANHIVVWDIAAGVVLQNFRAHEHKVRNVVFADNDTLLSQGYEGHKDAVKSWQPRTGKLQRSFDVQENWAGSAFSHDGKLLAITTVGDPNILRVWDTQTGKELYSNKEHYPNVFFSPDDRVLITSRQHRLEYKKYDTIVTLREPRTGKVIRRLEIKNSMTTVTDISPDGKLLVGHTHIDHEIQDKWRTRLQLFDAESGQPTKSLLEQRSGDMKSAHFSPDGKLVVAVNHNEHGISVWEVETGKKRWTFRNGRDFFNYPSFARDGKTLINTTSMARLFFHDLATGRTHDLNPTHTGHVASLAFTPDGKHLASASQAAELFLWDVKSGALVNRCEITSLKKDPNHYESAIKLAFAPDGKHLLAQQPDLRVRLFAPFKGREIATFRQAGYVSGFTDDGKQLLWTGVPIEQFQPMHHRGPTVVSEDFNFWLGTASWFAASVLYPEMRQFRPRAYFTPILKDDTVRSKGFNPFLEAHGVAASPFGLSPDGSVLVTWTNRLTGNPSSGRGTYWVRDGMILWDAQTRREIVRVKSRDQYDAALDRFTPDSRGYLARAAQPNMEKQSLKLFESRTGKERLHITDNFSPYGGLGLSHDGRWLTYINTKNAIELFDLHHGKIAATLPQLDSVVRFAFSHDGTMLATGGGGGTILIWDLRAIVKADPGEPAWTDEIKARLWADLASDESDKAYSAVMQLKRNPTQTTQLLRAAIQDQTAKADVPKLIERLGSGDFLVRQKSMDTLEQLGERARPHLLRALPDVASLEHKRRVESLLDKLAKPFTSPVGLRLLRSIEVLDALRTPEAAALLRELGAGMPPTDPLSREIARALGRRE